MRWVTMMTCLLLGGMLVFTSANHGQQKGPASSEEAIKKAQEDQAEAEKAIRTETEALAQAEKAVAERIALARKAADKAVMAEKAVAAAKDTAAKAAAEKTAAVAKDTAAKAMSARVAAEKILSQRAAAVNSAKAKVELARKIILAEKAWIALKAARAAETARADAEKTLAAQKTPEEKTAAQKVLAEKVAVLNRAQETAAQAHVEAIGGLKPITHAQWDYAKARHLLFRAGFGGTPEEIQRLVDMGPYKAVDHLVEYHRHPVPNLELEVETFDRGLPYQIRLHRKAQLEIADERSRKHYGQLPVLRQWWLRRMVESPRPLEEKLVLFWHDHFASSWLEVLDIHLMYQQNQLFRRHADKYDALLHGIVQDPAMIRYLTNDRNTKNNNNENLGREVLELFSMGEENSANHKKDGYTEKDVRDGMTRALTGYTYDRLTGQFRFFLSRHDTGIKTLLGRKGEFGPHEALDIVLQHPATARYVSKKMYEYFAHFDPDPQVIDRLAHVLRDSNYEVRTMLKNLFLSEEFYGPRAMGNHIKGPAELMVSTVKLLKLANVNYPYLDQSCIAMRQAFFDPPNVAGWPEGRAWLSAHLVLVRYNSVTNLIQQGKVDLVGLLDGQALNTPAEVVDHFARRCLLTNLPDEKRQSLIEFLGPLPPSSEWAAQQDQINARLRALLATLMSMPEYQVN